MDANGNSIPIDYSRLLTRAMGEIKSRFEQDELAYLALTSKIELPIRDKLAFALHSELGPKGFVIARGWERIDIAVLQVAPVRPVALIEMKAMYAFDAISNELFYELTAADVEKCLAKCRKRKINNVVVYTLLLATHPLHNPKEEYDGIIKYSQSIRRSIVNRKNCEEVLSDARSAVAGWPGTIANEGSIDGGTAFGMGVSVYYWLFGPHVSKELAAVL